MINDDYEYDIAASMDDLETLEFNSLQTSAKSIKFQKPPLPEIDENSTYVSDSSAAGSASNISETFRASAESLSTKLRKTAITNSGAGSGIDIPADAFNNNNINNNLNRGTNDDSDANKNGVGRPTPSDADTHATTTNTTNNNTVTGTRRKFIVTRMDSNAILRPEAENLRNLTAKSNAATIQFPCSAAINQRQPLAGIFASNASFEPHLDKRFFDTSLVEVRITADSTQSFDVGGQEHSVDGHSIWERRQIDDHEPKVIEFAPTLQIAFATMAGCTSEESQINVFRRFSHSFARSLAHFASFAYSDKYFAFFFLPISLAGIRKRWP